MICTGNSGYMPYWILLGLDMRLRMLGFSKDDSKIFVLESTSTKKIEKKKKKENFEISCQKSNKIKASKN